MSEAKSGVSKQAASMSGAKFGISCPDGQIPAQPRPGWNLLLHGNARGTPVDRSLVDHVGALRAAFRAARQERPFTIDAVVVLPDHLHAILTLPQRDADFAGRWRRIKGHFSTSLLAAGIAVRRHANGELALWQRRYWEHTIRDEHDLVRHVDYVHYNPVKHGLVTRVRDWPHSSFHLYVRRGVLPQDWAGDVNEGASGHGERQE